MNPRDVDERSVPKAFWSTLRRDPADPRVVQRAYWRFMTAAAPRRAPFGVWRWLFVGFAAGVGAVSAATVVRHVVVQSTGVAPREASVAKREAARAGATPHRRAVPTAANPAPSAPVPEAPSAAVAEAPSFDGAPLLDARSPSAPRQAVIAPPDDQAAPAALDPKWRRVSDALRAGDYGNAEAALRELETHGAAADRESASLALAQVLLARGRAVEARPRLERLSTTARSSLVRQKAVVMLTSLATSDRSNPSPADTH